MKIYAYNNNHAGKRKLHQQKKHLAREKHKNNEATEYRKDKNVNNEMTFNFLHFARRRKQTKV